MTNFFQTGFYKKPRTGTPPRLRPAPVAELESRATLPSTVNLRVPAEHKSAPAEEGRGPVVPPPQGLQPKLERAAYQEKNISIKDLNHNRPFQAGDPDSHSPSNPSAKGKEKLQGLGTPSRGEHVQSFHEQLHKEKNVILGECSKPAASPFGTPPAGPSELPDDHPLKQEEGSLLHSSYLVVSAHGKVLIEQLVDYFETWTSAAKKFPDNWMDDLENQLTSNRHFLNRKGLFTICKDLGQPPSKRIVKNKKEFKPPIVIGGQDKNLAEHSHVRTPRLPKPSDEDIDWTPSMEKQERAIATRRGGRRGSSKGQRVSEPEERNSSIALPIAAKECAQTSGIWRCTADALQGELYCAHHMRSSSAPLPIATKECAQRSGIWRCTSNALQGELYCAHHVHEKEPAGARAMSHQLQK